MLDNPDTLNNKRTKTSYTVPCSSEFRQAIDLLAESRGGNVADLARSVVSLMPHGVISAYPDPGEPQPGDRETVILKSGAAMGKPWRRKPRLQVRMRIGLSADFIRKALALALAVDRGERAISIEDPNAPPPVAVIDTPAIDMEALEAQKTALRERDDELDRLKTLVSILAFDPLPNGILNREHALHVFGFPPGSIPNQQMMRGRFRMLASIYHPDSSTGDHDRMAQINTAMEILRRGG